ncbi:ABC transporter substrate-binding protein [Candidatus Electrothrix sp.]|uniref:ABC transporter substrate-binding protein n=1 Tax=Candidatus Electrothrix sp. TaxID=2170559 RepID=UPI00405670B4
MRNKIIGLLTACFVTILIMFLVITNLSKPRIFVLHSYNLDFSWTRDINTGIERILKDKPYSIRWHYMDTKRNPSAEYKDKAGKIAVNAIKQWNPNIIITVDDNAQKYVAVHFKNSKSINIVFTGVNAEPKAYGFEKATNVTGVLERIPFQEFKEIFVQILPENKRRIVHISDASVTSQSIHEELTDVQWNPLKLVKSFQCETFEEWKQAIKKANKIGDILLVTHYHTILDKNGKTMNPSKVLEWTSPRLKIPDIGCWGFFVEDGGMMSVAVSPYEQGEEAAKMAVKIIEEKTPPNEIDVKINNLYVVYLRGSSLAERDIEIPKMLKAFAKATNTYYE